jgi:hypothetical protein
MWRPAARCAHGSDSPATLFARRQSDLGGNWRAHRWPRHLDGTGSAACAHWGMSPVQVSRARFGAEVVVTDPVSCAGRRDTPVPRNGGTLPQSENVGVLASAIPDLTISGHHSTRQADGPTRAQRCGPSPVADHSSLLRGERGARRVTLCWHMGPPSCVVLADLPSPPAHIASVLSSPDRHNNWTHPSFLPLTSIYATNQARCPSAKTASTPQGDSWRGGCACANTPSPIRAEPGVLCELSTNYPGRGNWRRQVVRSQSDAGVQLVA